MPKILITHSCRFLALLWLMVVSAAAHAVSDNETADSRINVAVKSNLLYDAALTPDVGMEIAFPSNISIGLEGMCAWWSNSGANRYWRIRGIWTDVNYWFGSASVRRALSGHHIGIYGSCHDFDFEFGRKGWQSYGPVFGGGISSGYSLRLNRRLNIDFCIRAGYSGGRITAYVPQCGRYVATESNYRHYVGITGLAVTLVWFPGRDNFNNPAK